MSEYAEHVQKKNLICRSELLRKWLLSPSGRTIFEAEQQYIDNDIKHIFGYHGCQVSIINDLDLLANSRINHHFKLAFETTQQPTTIYCHPYYWPVEPESLDLLILHHMLDVADNPQRLLTQAANSLIPDGKLLITGFNPWSLTNVSRWLLPEQRRIFKGIRFITSYRLQDWLALLGFRLESICFGAYANLLKKVFKCEPWQSVKPYGYQWRLPLGSFYNILASREVHGITPIKRLRLNVGNPLAGQSIVRPLVRESGENSEQAR